MGHPRTHDTNGRASESSRSSCGKRSKIIGGMTWTSIDVRGILEVLEENLVSWLALAMRRREREEFGS